jgi:thioredoxin 2
MTSTDSPIHPKADHGVVQPCPECGRLNRLSYERLAELARCSACKADITAPREPVVADEGAALGELLRTATLPVLVDFWAPWCGPCRQVAPEVAKVAERQAGQLLVVKVNTEIDPTIGDVYRIQSIPTMAVYRDGREVARTSGARPAAAIESFVRESLAAR